jgi:hypothetical protein
LAQNGREKRREEGKKGEGRGRRRKRNRRGHVVTAYTFKGNQDGLL